RGASDPITIRRASAGRSRDRRRDGARIRSGGSERSGRSGESGRSGGPGRPGRSGGPGGAGGPGWSGWVREVRSVGWASHDDQRGIPKPTEKPFCSASSAISALNVEPCGRVSSSDTVLGGRGGQVGRVGRGGRGGRVGRAGRAVWLRAPSRRDSMVAQ